MMSQDESSAGSQSSTLQDFALESVRLTLELYRSGKSGIPFETLRAYAEPILTHYQIELGGADEEQVTPNNLEEITLLLDVLETASMFWEYCNLDEPRKRKAFKPLRESLLGPNPGADNLLQFPMLLAAMEERWADLTGSERSAPLPSSSCAGDALWDSAPGAPMEVNGSTRYGPDGLEIPEAFALFSRPLLEDDRLLEDPDRLGEIMVRAQAYWDLAHAPAAQREAHLKTLLSQFRSGSMPAHRLREEAGIMLQRFHELFPERK